MKSFVVDVEDVVRNYSISYIDMLEIADKNQDVREIAKGLRHLSAVLEDLNSNYNCIGTFTSLVQDGMTMMMFPPEVFEEMEIHATKAEGETEFAVIVKRNDKMIGVIDGKNVNW
jgi:predicted transcriptional regulator